MFFELKPGPRFLVAVPGNILALSSLAPRRRAMEALSFRGLTISQTLVVMANDESVLLSVRYGQLTLPNCQEKEIPK